MERKFIPLSVPNFPGNEVKIINIETKEKNFKKTVEIHNITVISKINKKFIILY